MADAPVTQVHADEWLYSWGCGLVRASTSLKPCGTTRRGSPEQVRPGRKTSRTARPRSLAKLSTYDDRSARLAGIGLMLLSIFMFLFGDLMENSPARYTIFGRAIALATCLPCAHLLVLLPDHLEAARGVFPARTSLAAIAAGDALNDRSRGVLSRHRLSAARRCHHLLPRGTDFRHSAVGTVLGEQIGWRRWTTILIGFCGVLIALRPRRRLWSTGLQ